MTGRRPNSCAALLASCALALSACSVANSGGGQLDATAANTVRIVLPEEPPTLEPCDATLTATGRVTRSNITEALTERDPTSGELEPALATRWRQTSPTSWTFTLRSGVRFHDGTSFDARAAAFSIARAVGGDLDCNVDGYVFGDSKLKAVPLGSRGLRVETAKPDPILPLRLSFVEVVPATTSTKEKVRKPVGTGPYRLARWDTGRSMRLERFDGYWGERPDFAAAEYVWRSEGTIRAAMINSDEADVAIGLASQDGAGRRGIEFPNNETSYLRIDATKPPLDDIRIRQAINFALDKKGLVESVFGGLGTPAGQIVTKSVKGYNPAIKPWPFDKNRAKALVAAARADGVPTDRKITIIGRTGIYPKAAETMEAAQGALLEAGLDVEIRMLEVNAWLEYLLRPFPAADAGPTLLQAQHGNQAGDAAFTMEQIYGSKGEQSSYGTRELDAMISDATEATGSKRWQGFADALAYQSQRVVRDAVIAHMGGIIALSDKVAYRPDAATNDELRLREMRRKG